MRYFAMIDGVQCGPFTLEQLPENGVTPETYVWCKGMDDWEQAADVADICRFYRQRLAGINTGNLPQTNVVNDPEQPLTFVDTLTEEEREALEELPPAFRRFVEKHGVAPGPRIPSDEEQGLQPHAPLLLAFFLTLLCFPPTGFVALYYCYRTRKAWQMSQATTDAEERKSLIAVAYEAQRQSRIWLGITFFFGMVLLAFTMNFV